MKSVSREELKEMGKRGLKTIEENYTKEIVTSKYVDLVDELLNTNTH